MLGGIFVAHLTLISAGPLLVRTDQIADTFSSPGGQFLATKNGPPGPLLAPDQIFHDRVQCMVKTRVGLGWEFYCRNEHSLPCSFGCEVTMSFHSSG